MEVDSDTLDTLLAPVVISCDGKEVLMHGNTAFFVYYAGRKVMLNENYFPFRRDDIIGLWGYNGAQKKYVFTAYKPDSMLPSVRIIPAKKQVVANYSVLADSGEIVKVQNHERIIVFSLNIVKRKFIG
ncbi:MAG: hypothetical protein QW165_01360 [Candidatus Woesearchaeota archaeon]